MKYTIPSLKILGAALLISLLGAGAAHATLITLNYNFTGSGFPAGAPFDPVTGSFSLTFDNSADITNSSAITASISIPVTGSILFSYNATFDFVELGANGVTNGVTNGTNDFGFRLHNVSTTPTFESHPFDYTQQGVNGIFVAQNFALRPPGAGVPDTSSSLGLLALGVTALGLVRRKVATVQV
jgi:hypothetical protein